VELASTGNYLRPALFAATPAMTICREEVFGPVAAVLHAHDFDTAVAIVNDSPFGLCAGVCTTSLAHASEFRRRAETGMVMVNLPTAGVDPHVPFGGRKGSSYGPKEQGAHAREFFTQLKIAYVSPGTAS
jgi:aldehyde dehydrogenase (NAD+)